MTGVTRQGPRVARRGPAGDRGGTTPRPDGRGPAERRRLHRAAVAAVVVVGAVLRLMHLDDPIRYDEAVTRLRYVSLPLAEALAAYDLPNNHVLHTLLARLSVDALGDTLPALRLPAWASGTLVVPATYLVGRTLRGPGVGLLAAALAAGSPVLVLFSANARGYALVVLAALALAGSARALARRWSPGAWGAFVLAAALGAWTMPVMVYPAVAAAAWWAVAAHREGGPAGSTLVGIAGAAAAAGGLAALLYLPVVREAGLDALVANRFVAPRPPGEFVAAVPGFLVDVAREWAHGVPAWASALVMVGVGVEAAALVSGRRSGPPPLFPVWAGASLLVLAATRRTPFPRVWLFLLPPLLIFAASGLARAAEAAASISAVRPGARGAALATAALPPILAAALGATVVRGDVVRTWGLTGSLPAGDRVADFVARRWQPGDVVLAELPSDAPLRYYLRRRGLPPGAVDAPPEPGRCVFAVVNRRHGQTLRDVAGPLPRGLALSELRSWGETVVYGGRADGERPGETRDRGSCVRPGGSGRGPAGWRRRRRADTFPPIGLPARRGSDGRGERENYRRTTERPGLP